jgi:hypothetical protein
MVPLPTITRTYVPVSAGVSAGRVSDVPVPPSTSAQSELPGARRCHW